MQQAKQAEKRTLVVFGLKRDCKEEIVRDAFLPFGPIKSVRVVNSKVNAKGQGRDQGKGRDHGKGRNQNNQNPKKDFKFWSSHAFVEFEDLDDARNAYENMNGAELPGNHAKHGGTLRVAYSQSQRHQLGSKESLWANNESQRQPYKDVQPTTTDV